MDEFNEGIYPGVRCNAATLNAVWTKADPADSGGRLFWTPILVVDLPFSIVADTICLPYDVLKETGTEQEH